MQRTNAIHVLARAAIIDGDKILLCKTVGQHPDFYYLPGGHIEEGEGARDTLARELLEEGGVEAEIGRFLGCLEHVFEPDARRKVCHKHEYNLLFEARPLNVHSGEPLPQLESHIHLQWIPLNQLPAIDLKPAAWKTLIGEWLEEDSRNPFMSSIEGKD